MEKRPVEVFKNILSILKNSFRVRGIQSMIAISFTLITILAMVILGAVLFNMFSNSAEIYAASSMQQIMEQVSLNIEHYLKGMVEISDLITHNLYNDINLSREKLSILFDTILKIRNDIITLAVFSDTGELIISNPSEGFIEDLKVTEQEWFKTVEQHPDQYVYLPPHVQRMFDGKHPWVVSLCRGVAYYADGKKKNCVTMVDMNFSSIDEMCKTVSLGKRGYIYIIDGSGNIIYHPQQQIIYAGLKNENIEFALKLPDGSFAEVYGKEKRLVTVKTVKYTAWKIVGISYVDDIVTSKKKFQLFITFVFIFTVVLMILASVFISVKVSKPIKMLENQMKRVEKGEFDINIDVKGEDEVKHLSRTFNLMVARIRQLMNQIIEEQEAKRKSELRALQAQINPHFLYNTLDSIVWMNENRKYEGVTTMVSALAKLFRISISKGSDIITVQDELEHARSYLVIQKIRYGDKFDFIIEAQPEVLNCKTLKLILQPIIENAIYHGIERIHDKGLIKVTASIKDKRILLQVIDNGYGIKPEVLANILKKDSKSDAGSGTRFKNVGLKNVHERLQLYFGKQYGLEIDSELDVGTTVNIWLPYNNTVNEEGTGEIAAQENSRNRYAVSGGIDNSRMLTGQEFVKDGRPENH